MENVAARQGDGPTVCAAVERARRHGSTARWMAGGTVRAARRESACSRTDGVAAWPVVLNIG
eukprot:4329057-Prymnesium_polylepis.1